MTSILNVFSDKEINEIPKNKKVSPSLKHGEKFKKYQNKFEDSLENAEILSGKEGFSDMEDKSLTKQTDNIISNNNYSNQQQIIDNLRQEYQNTIQQYEDLIDKISGNLTDYVDRVNPNNPYLNKVVQFTTGDVCYVTSTGVVKYIPSNEVWKSSNIPQSIQVSLNIPYINSYATPGTQIPTNPPLVAGTKLQMGQSVGNEGSNVFVNQLLPSDTTPTYMGCYAANSSNDNMIFIGGSPVLDNSSFSGSNTSGVQSNATANVSLNSSTETGGSYSYNQCKEAAVINGYRYFGLQNVNLSTGLGYCTVSNSKPEITQYGNSQIPSKLIALWSSNTSGQSGNTAILSNTGSLQVINSSGQAVYSTPSRSANPSNYLGCYGDKPLRAMSKAWKNTSQQYNNSQCQKIAEENNYKYYGLQNSTSGTNAVCFLSNNIEQTMQYGKASNCTRISDGSWSGGGWSNAVYNTTLPQSNYFLILQGDGNMCVYRGTSPTDNQGQIWASGTNGKTQSSNPQMVSKNGKYGKNWMTSGSTLAAGEFIGSNDGKLALVMQTDGNLVLYTYQMETNCKKMSDGNMGGGVGGNAAYDIGKTAVSGNMGAIGYVDADSNLYTYPSTNETYTSNYTTINNMNTAGNDIQGASFGNATLDSCETACNNNSKCAGFVFNGNTCWPKTNQMFPFGNSVEPSTGTQIYVRGKMPTSPPLGVSQSTNITDSVTYQNYINKGQVGSQYGLANATNAQKQELEQLQTRMNLLSSKITDLTNNFQGGTLKAENQNQKNNAGIEDYFKDIITTNKKIGVVSGETSSNIHNILKDSDIVVLQKNYDYLFWSILAAGTVLVSMNIVKKQ